MNYRACIALITNVFILVCGCTKGIDGNNGDVEISLNQVTKASVCHEDNFVYYDGYPYTEIPEPFLVEDMEDSLYNFVLKKYGIIGGKFSLKPTHYVVKLEFKDIDQLNAILKDSALFFRQHPFNLRPLSFECALNSDSCSNFGGASFDRSHENMEECEISTGDSNNVELKPLFVFWPASRPLPEDVDCTVCYQAFVPGSYNPDRGDCNAELIQEWVSSFLNRSVPYLLKFKAYDTRLEVYKPIGGFAVSYWSSGRLCVVAVPSSGQIMLYDVPSSASSLTLSFYTSDFAIREGLTSNVYTISTGPLSNYGGGGFCDINLPANFYLDVFQSVRYYFTGSNDILNSIARINNSTSFFSINACDYSHSNGYLGVFYPSNPHVEIYNPYSYPTQKASSKVFGTVMHELWHATHYYMMDSSAYSGVHSFIKESFASFFGWYNVLFYYSSVVSNHQQVNSICTQGRQTWTPNTTTNVNYTPLFVDLFDNYNQPALDDDISFVPCGSLLDVVSQSYDFDDIVDELDSLVLEGHLTSSQRNTIYNNYQRFL